MPLPYYSAATDVGTKRTNNEDAIASSPKDKLWLVADGMGGHAAGEVASAIASETVQKLVSEGQPLPAAIQAAHEAILAQSDNNNGHQGMGSTIVALLSKGHTYEIAWVGDSRAYLWSQSGDNITLEQLTTDHSYVQLLYQSGAITFEEMSTHPDKNVITQCLGSIDIETVKVDTIKREWHKDDWVLLCSDGLSDAVDDQTICNILNEHDDVTSSVDALIQKALENGGKDNISVALISQPPTGFRRILRAILPDA